MRFRTEIETKLGHAISANSRLVLIGSCFADNIGKKLCEHGFDVVHNPLGPLFNPLSTANAIESALDNECRPADNVLLHDNIWHAMDWASRYQNENRDKLQSAVNKDLAILKNAIARADTLFVTFGTAYVYFIAESGRIAGNCHKLPSGLFIRRRIGIEEITERWAPLLKRLEDIGKRVVFTVSPVRHVADGLHANNVSKATLMLAVDRLGAEYFPAYEIVCDDLRDYRFYASDLKHPSESAVDYIFEKFSDTYFTQETKEISRARYADYLRAAHRPGNNQL